MHREREREIVIYILVYLLKKKNIHLFALKKYIEIM